MNCFKYCFIFVAYCTILVRTELPRIRICCPKGQLLIRYSLKALLPDKYECKNFDQAQINMTSVISGFEIMYPNPENYTDVFSNCERINLFEIANENLIDLDPNSCLTFIDNKITALTCMRQSKPNRLFPQIAVLHKCCPADTVYNSILKKCVLGNISYEVFKNVFDHGIIFIHQILQCPKNKVLVEYKVPKSHLKYDSGTINMIASNQSVSFKNNEYCVEAIDGKNKNFLLRTCSEIAICKNIGCIRKCCEDGELFVKGNATSYCKKDMNGSMFQSFESLYINANFTKPKVFGILRSLDCLKFRLDPDSYPDEAHVIDPSNGLLIVNSTGKTYLNKQYCLEKIHSAHHKDQKLYTFLCFDSKVVGNDRFRFKLYPVGLLISCCFYLMTLIVYLSISKLRNLPGQILICLVSSLLAAYLGIALGQLMPTKNDNICFVSELQRNSRLYWISFWPIIGFFVYFCLMAAFSWMNVTCFDIWQTFGSTRTKRCFKKANRKRFIIYSAYGWGLPSTLTTITILLTKLNILSESIRPNFGHGRCWFTYDTFGSASLLFFSGPVGILFFINFVLFTLTSTYCNKVKKEIFRMQSSNEEKPVLRRRFFIDKARFVMNTKLFIVMGITWLLELLSILFYDHKKTFFWAISDSFNVLLGVFVFIIFVFKKRVWISIREVFGNSQNNNGRSTRYATYATHSTVIQQNITMIPIKSVNSNLLNTTSNDRFA